MVDIRPAREEDVAAIQAYLTSRGDTCMFMRSNLAAAGLRWEGAPLQGQYLIARRDDAVVGVVAHYWNGMLLVQADECVEELSRAAIAHTKRHVQGFTGAVEQVRAARAALGFADRPTHIDHDEVLMALGLDGLAIPPPLTRGEVTVRRVLATDRDTVVPWRTAYLIETNSETEANAGPTAATWFENTIGRDPPWIALRGDEAVAICAFNARVSDTVQVGGVYTPPALRNRGHARAVVAGALLDARDRGVSRAILFTPRPDAVAAYRAIGFEPIGRFAVVLFA
jgi:GNAT superfamily N-acetyltransferase